MPTVERPARAAISAASFTRLARSAPEKPGVPRAIERRSTSGSSATLRACTRRICSRPLRSGLPTVTCRSNRPGRSSAGSRMSARLVAATTMMLSDWEKPSISTSSWLSVCSRSSWLSELPPRLRPTASSSSMKMMHDGWRRASLNSLRTRDAPTPAYISTKSEPLAEMNGTPASPAIDRASSVLPVPGGPTSRMPRGMRPPIEAKRRRLLQEVDDLPHLVLRLVHARHVVERHGDAFGIDGLQLLEASARGPRAAGGRRRARRRPEASSVNASAPELPEGGRPADVEAHAARDEAGHERGRGGDVALRRQRLEPCAVAALEREGVAIHRTARTRLASTSCEEGRERHGVRSRSGARRTRRRTRRARRRWWRRSRSDGCEAACVRTQ